MLLAEELAVQLRLVHPASLARTVIVHGDAATGHPATHARTQLAADATPERASSLERLGDIEPAMIAQRLMRGQPGLDKLRGRRSPNLWETKRAHLVEVYPRLLARLDWADDAGIVLAAEHALRVSRLGGGDLIRRHLLQREAGREGHPDVLQDILET
ncbi:hypothetical protein J8273_2616 [Carpediemonas membranifera]|uniref:Uncharacterized protein n=1 Tax=Carpediemonas membranifera TaxID=201153 RepID=A0A8J6EAY4_9EUKA|nr:hypothetical protein J8273_2616 [Carpediemonas membranifera]|eukprot:KAG9395710.1 hypothetical protein J8273_2616 [Carpediemonas membranifera]